MEDSYNIGLGERKVEEVDLSTTNPDRGDGKHRKPPRIKKNRLGEPVAGLSSVLWTTNPIPMNEIIWRPKTKAMDIYAALGSQHEPVPN